jgi:hypothetical protein
VEVLGLQIKAKNIGEQSVECSGDIFYGLRVEIRRRCEWSLPAGVEFSRG